jgi:hypothetical protein
VNRYNWIAWILAVTALFLLVDDFTVTRPPTAAANPGELPGIIICNGACDQPSHPNCCTRDCDDCDLCHACCGRDPNWDNPTVEACTDRCKLVFPSTCQSNNQ